MAKINFSLSQEKQAVVNPATLNAPMLDSGGSNDLQAPALHMQEQAAATLPIPHGNVPLLDPGAVQQGLAHITNAALQYQDRTDDLNAADAAMRARLDAGELLHKIPQKEGELPGYLTLKGKEAVDTAGEVQNRLKKLYDEDYAQGLSGNARAKYLMRVAPHKESDLIKAATHTAKQQEEYRGQEQFAHIQLLAQTVERGDVDKAMKVDYLQGMSQYYNKEEQSKYSEEVFGYIVDYNLAQKDGAPNAAAFMNKYGYLATPEARLKQYKKIQPALKAFDEQRKADAKELRKTVQAEVEAQAPAVLASHLMAGDADGFVAKAAEMMTYFTKEDTELGPKKAAEAAENVVYYLASQGKNSYQIDALVKQVSGNPNVDVLMAGKMVHAVSNVRKDEIERRGQVQTDNANALISQLEYDPTTRKPNIPRNIRPAEWELSPEMKKWAISTQMGTTREAEDIRTDKQREDDYNAAYVAAVMGQAPIGSPEHAALLQKQINPNARLSKEQMGSVMTAIKSAEDKEDKDVALNMVKDELKRMAGQGLLSAEMKDRGANAVPYPLNKHDRETIRAQAEILQEFQQWRKANPKADTEKATEWFDKTLQRRAVMTGGFFGFNMKENYPPTSKIGGQSGKEQGQQEGQGQGRQGVLEQPAQQEIVVPPAVMKAIEKSETWSKKYREADAKGKAKILKDVEGVLQNAGLLNAN